MRRWPPTGATPNAASCSFTEPMVSCEPTFTCHLFPCKLFTHSSIASVPVVAPETVVVVGMRLVHAARMHGWAKGTPSAVDRAAPPAVPPIFVCHKPRQHSLPCVLGLVVVDGQVWLPAK